MLHRKVLLSGAGPSLWRARERNLLHVAVRICVHHVVKVDALDEIVHGSGSFQVRADIILPETVQDFHTFLLL